MGCPTCDHTMNLMGETERLFWCPRCGTIQRAADGGRYAPVSVPALVSAVRETWSLCGKHEDQSTTPGSRNGLRPAYDFIAAYAKERQASGNPIPRERRKKQSG